MLSVTRRTLFNPSTYNLILYKHLLTLDRLVLIVSNSLDPTVEIVRDWLVRFNCNFLIFNTKDFIKKINFKYNLELDDTCLFIEHNRRKYRVVSAWFRKDIHLFHDYNELSLIESQVEKTIKHQLNNEYKRVKESIFGKKHSDVKWINGYVSPNKIDVSIEAKKCGLTVPDFIITNNKSALKKFILKHKSVIVKAISESLRIVDKDEGHYFQYTTELSSEILISIPNKFFPTLVQKKIEKSYDVRVVYLAGDFYPAGIHQEGDSIDCRENLNNYYKTQLSKIVIDEKLKQKIGLLMNKFNLNFGCIDFAVDNSGEFYFLEVNCLGDFSNISYYCNFNIEYKVASFLNYNSLKNEI